MDLPALLLRMVVYFEEDAGSHMVDQAWQPRLVDGMVRAYLVADRVAGFGHQAINALYPAAPGASPPAAGPRLYHAADAPQFQGLRQLMDTQWIALLCERFDLTREQLPLLWDCDFIPGEPGPDGAERFVLCEINVSSVSPFPPSSVAPLVEAMQARLRMPQ